MANNFKTPPTLNKNESYENWEKAVKLWQLVTEIPKIKQGAAMVLALSGKDRDVALELSMEELNTDNGVENILNKLGKIYKKDSVDTAYETFENFIKYTRDTDVSIATYISEFERRYSKAKEHGCELSSSVLAYFLLNQAKLSDNNNKLVKATVTKLDFEEMKSKLKKVFGSGESDKVVQDDFKIKIEDINISEENEEDVFYGRYGNSRPFPRYSGRGYPYNRGTRGAFRPNRGASGSYNSYNNRGPMRGKYFGAHNENKEKKVRCSICESIYHKSYECPDKIYFAEEEDIDYDVVLYQSNLLTESQYNVFVAESSASAILDSGASATVTGKIWLESYCQGLSKDQLREVKYNDSSNSFKFGSDQKFSSLYKATIPAKIGNKNVKITTDVVNTTVPLLLSKEAMKKAGTEINFVNDEVVMFGEKQVVQITQSGHYAIPLNDSRNILNDMNSRSNLKINLIASKTDLEDKKKVALKLHAQFGHPPRSKLIKLIERAGLKHDKSLVHEINEIDKNCQICKQFKKPTPTPAVGLPHASRFNEMVAMDLKFFDGKIILHLIDHLTRFSSAIVVKSKEAKEIVNGIVRCWIAIFGPPKKFLTDNGGEFASSTFLELAESMNIRVLNTAAESPWSNGLVERHNGTLGVMLNKIMAEQHTDIHTALAWAVQAKNALANVHGFSPVQLTLGYNPQLPCVLNDKLPALEVRSSEDIITENLNCMKLAREAFIKSESCDKIKRALKHNIRPSSHNKFFNGDIVFYKRNDSRKWKGPGKVLGSDSSNILIKHGPQYVRVHACRVSLDKRDNSMGDNGNEDIALRNNPTEQDENVPADTSVQSSDESSEEMDEALDSASENKGMDEGERVDDAECGTAQPIENIPATAAGTQEYSLTKMKKPNLKKGMKIIFKRNDGDWEEGEVVRRSGKATGKYKDYWYVNSQKTGEVEEFNVVTDLEDLKLKDDESVEELFHDVYNVEEIMKVELTEDVIEAKKMEIDKWIEEGVFNEVTDEGQEKLSTTWVITTKMKDGKVITKARLVVRGYEESDKDIRSDSPTCMKENVRMLLAVAAAMNWNIMSLDVKAAFLQGKRIERKLYVIPPKDYRKDNVIWQLNKVVYGLCDASRSWYLRVCEVLTNLGMSMTSYDKAVFTFRIDKHLEGLLLIHVDDMLYFGSKVFIQSVIEPFRSTFQISREESQAFKYLGMELNQSCGHIELNQGEYLQSLNGYVLSKEAMREKYRFVDDKERKIFKRAVGQLGWLTTISKPEAAFMYCTLSTRQSNPQVQDFIKYAKIIKELQSTTTKIVIKKMKLETIRVSVFSDASFGNLAEGASQIGHISFIHDDEGCSVPISWASRKAKRVARSTLTAETLAAVDAVDNAYVTKAVLEETLSIKLPPITLYVDNKSLFDTAKTSNMLADKRLLIDMSALRQMVERGEIVIQWVSTDKQLADVLTKSGVLKQKLTDVLSSGYLNLSR